MEDPPEFATSPPPPPTPNTSATTTTSTSSPFPPPSPPSHIPPPPPPPPLPPHSTIITTAHLPPPPLELVNTLVNVTLACLALGALLQSTLTDQVIAHRVVVWAVTLASFFCSMWYLSHLRFFC